MKYWLILFLVISSICLGAERQNINVDENWTPKDEEYFMCNFYCATPKTQLLKVKNVKFIRSNFYGCEVDESNTLIKSNVIDTTPKPILTLEQLKTQKIELENQLAIANKEIPKEYYEEWISLLKGVMDE